MEKKSSAELKHGDMVVIEWSWWSKLLGYYDTPIIRFSSVTAHFHTHFKIHNLFYFNSFDGIDAFIYLHIHQSGEQVPHKLATK